MNRCDLHQKGGRLYNKTRIRRISLPGRRRNSAAASDLRQGLACRELKRCSAQSLHLCASVAMRAEQEEGGWNTTIS